MKPMMHDYQIEIIEEELLGLNKSHIDVLEWGGGGSTVYFTDFLKKNKINYTWATIEHNPEWYEKVSDFLGSDKNMSVYFFNLNDEKNNYIKFPSQLEREFDFILVDGRKRKECLIEAQKILKPNGIVILHDAQRSRYHDAFKYYHDSRFIELELWRGTNREISFSKRIANRLNYIYFRIIKACNKVAEYKNSLTKGKYIA